MPRQASKKGGRSGHGLRFQRGPAAPEAVAQPRAGQRLPQVADLHVRDTWGRTSAPVSHVRLWIGIGRAEDPFAWPTAPPRTRSVSSPALTPALLGAHGGRAVRSAIRCCRTAAPGHRTRPRSLAVRSCGSSSSRSPSAAPPRVGRRARTSCTRGRALVWRSAPNYCLPRRPRSFRERRESTNPLLHFLRSPTIQSRLGFACARRNPGQSTVRRVFLPHSLSLNKLNPPRRLVFRQAAHWAGSRLPAARGGAAPT